MDKRFDYLLGKLISIKTYSISEINRGTNNFSLLQDYHYYINL